jgi:O-antigen/teichoic acid export membrane protein
VLVRREVHVLPSFDLSRWRFLLGQTVVVAAATTLTTVYFQVVVVATSLLSNAGQLGSFSLAFRVLTVVVGIPGLLVTSALPIFIRAARDDRERLRFALQRLIEGALLIGGWFSLLVVTGAGFAVHILGGPGYPGSAGALEILGWGLIATFLQLVFQLTLFSLQRYRTLIVMNAAMLLASVALCVALIPRYGAHGAAIVTLSVEVALAVASGAALFISNRSLLPRDSRPARAVVAVVIAFGVALVVPVSSVVAALIGSATLAAAATLLRAAPAGLFAALRPDR